MKKVVVLVCGVLVAYYVAKEMGLVEDMTGVVDKFNEAVAWGKDLLGLAEEVVEVVE